MPKKLIREIAASYGYQRLRNYRQWEVIDSVEVEENATREEINEIVKDEILNRVGWDWIGR